MPSLELPPELVLLLVLPPLIYSASVAMSWREFRFNLRVDHPAVGRLRDFHRLRGRGRDALPDRAAVDASASCSGAIVAPPDVVAPLAIARKLGLPRRILVVLEGEGLANDATALILYRFAVAAISTGLFSLPQGDRHLQSPSSPAKSCSAPRSAGSACAARHRARDPQVEITLSLITPYIAYWIPEHFGGSGVIATVACGLYMSWNGPLLISSATRLQGIFFWDLVIYLIEGLLFLLTGFQMRLAVGEIEGVSARRNPVRNRAGRSSSSSSRALPGSIPPPICRAVLSKRLRERDPYPSWRTVFVIAFTGVRGAVSLAAALALPYALPSGEAFPLSRPDPVRRLRRHLHHAGRDWAWCCRRWCDGSASRRTAAANMSPSTKRKSRRGARRSTRRCNRSMP